MKIVNKFLEDGEYYKDVVEKTTILLHHTAGSHRPDWVIDGWERDRSKSGGQLAVATAYVIGGISTTDRNIDFDGVIYKAFEDKYWAHHIGMEAVNNKILNQQSIGIEICNYGPIIKTKDGIFLNYVNKPVPVDMVAELDEPFRGFKYYHKYTDKQLVALKELILDIKARYPKIDLKKGLLESLVNQKAGLALEQNSNALKGNSGIWSHTNFRKDKFDVWPQIQLINLLKSL